MEQTSIFDVTEARERRDAGMELALDAKQAWQDAATRWVLTLCCGNRFTADDLVAVVGLPAEVDGAHRNNAVGALLGGLSKRGSICKAGYAQSKRTTNQGRVLAVWERR